MHYCPLYCVMYILPVQCILLPNDERKFLPAEWTPLYAGVPVPLADASGARYGGGWVEPLD